MPVRREAPPTAGLLDEPPGPEPAGHLDRRIATLAARQRGVVTRAQLVALGLGPRGIDARVTRGALHRLHRSVYAVGHPVVLGLGREQAALLAAGPGAVRSHRTAALRWDLRGGAGAVEVIAARSRRSQPGIVVHPQRVAPEEVTVLDGLPLTTVARTIFDLAEVLTPEQHKRTWETAQRLQLADVLALRAVAERNPGRRALRVILPLLKTQPLAGLERTRSPLEVDFLEFAARWLAHHPTPEVNHPLHGYEVDAYFAAARLAVELDSRAFHDNPLAFETDRAKWNALTAGGETVFPLTSRRLRDEPELVAAQLDACLRAAGGPRSGGVRRQAPP